VGGRGDLEALALLQDLSEEPPVHRAFPPFETRGFDVRLVVRVLGPIVFQKPRLLVRFARSHRPVEGIGCQLACR